MSDEDFLRRWSRRKTEARKAGELEEPREPEDAAKPVATLPAQPAAPVAETPLPPVESLTPDSDFTPFMRPKVDGGLRNQALKTLFADPRFNVMDGLDVYIDDYSKPDPLPEGWLEKMSQVARLGVFEPPKEESVDAAAEAAKEQPPEGEAASGETPGRPSEDVKPNS
jgi:hypothetical protein